MPKKMTHEQRQSVLRLLALDTDRETIAATVGVTPGQVSAIAAHVKMGTYELPVGAHDAGVPIGTPSSSPLLTAVTKVQSETCRASGMQGVLLGVDIEKNDAVYWNPDSDTGAQNPHVLILGESGSGKTYAISAVVAELAQQRVGSAVFDYGQGFSRATLPREFFRTAEPVELDAGHEGLNVNPLQVFPSDVHGPVNVAQRVADTFARIYPRIGVQQHSAVRQAVLDVLADSGIRQEIPGSWSRPLPLFRNIHAKLAEYAAEPRGPHGRFSSSAASHISTMFVFNTFRPSGQALDWSELLSGGQVAVIQLRGLEHSLERAVTEFLLWNLIGYVESLGPGPLRCFVVLDEAHKLSFDQGSPVEKLLREGRKFGIGLILASQQPEDFSPVAFANTATKLIFQVGDERSAISRQLHRKIRNSHSFGDIHALITRLPRGCAYVVSENVGRVVKVTEFKERTRRWARPGR